MSIFSVTQLNEYTKAILDEDPILSDITVTGEISNFKRHSSGHLYFSLKDEKSAIAVTMFKWQAMYLRFAPSNGVKVVAKGRVTLYEPTGQYQLVVTSLQPDGIGALYAAYEKLRARLSKEGLFENKKPLPFFPKRIGVISSKTGAAVQDILNVLGRRYPMAEVVLCPVLVQGQQAAEQLCAAVKKLNHLRACDVIIIGRGGGSIEDLWAFNDEQLARAVAASEIPVISAVGHETDYTICDFAADLRAPTPSAAAELAVPDAQELLLSLEGLRLRMYSDMCDIYKRCRNEYEYVIAGRGLTTPMYQIELRTQTIDMLTSRIDFAYKNIISENAKKLSAVAARLSALDPMRVLARGYCAASGENGIISSVTDIKNNDNITLRFSDGTAQCVVSDTEVFNNEEKADL